jgi:DNA-binding response OmpR family regulator
MAAKRILLVEDDRAVRFMLTLVLRGESYVVDSVESAVAALSYLARERYDLVISDWRLPDGDGLEIADEAAELGAKTIVMSGDLFQIPSEVRNRHEHKFLMKPMRPSELVNAVHCSIHGGRRVVQRKR